MASWLNGNVANPMKIAIFTQYYKPENAKIPNSLAQGLAERGHSVRVVTAFPSYPGDKLYPGWRQRPVHHERDGDVMVRRVPLFLSHSSNPLGRLANYLSFAASSSLAVRFVRDVDVIYVYATPMTAAIGARRLSRSRGIPLILHIQDVWPESVTGSSMVPGRRAAHCIGRMLEHWLRGLYRDASALISIAPSMGELLVDRGVAREKVHTVLNWEPASQTTATVARSNPISGLKVMYAGNVGDMQDLNTAIRAASRLRDAVDFELVIVGSGTAEPRLRRLADEIGAINVTFRGAVPAGEMAAEYESSHFQLVSLKRLDIFRGTIPSKFQASLAHGRPVITTVAGDLTEIVTTNQLGFACPPENVEALELVFREALAMPPDARALLNRRVLAFYQDMLAPHRGIDEVEKILSKAALERTVGRE